jgi:hypothetical protein
MAGLTQWVVWSLLVSLVTCETSQQWRARIEANIDRVRKADAEIRELSHRVHRIFKPKKTRQNVVFTESYQM